MNKKIKSSFKKRVFLVIMLLLSVTIISPISQSQAVNNLFYDKEKNNIFEENQDFSIRLHRIISIDDIDPGTNPEWELRMYVNDIKKTYECEGEDVFVDKNFIWDEIITEGMKYVEIKMELLENDLIWDDIADISAYIDEDYQEGDYDNTDDFANNRPAVFKRTYNLVTEDWEPVDDDNDYLTTEYQNPLTWFVTSGNYDGSTTVDENDAAIWFSVSIGNTPPYAPERPTGETFGWIQTVYYFETKSHDDDGDLIQFAWDWEGDGDIDEITSFYDSWETSISPHYWIFGQIFYVKVMAIDERGLCSEWSEPLKVRINAPGGINGVEVGEWALGHEYCLYYNHEKTQEIMNTWASGGNIITALATLITAVATACGVPFPYAIAFTIATAIARLGVEIIRLCDKGMGIYVKIYHIEVFGTGVLGFGYVWSQTSEGLEGKEPVENLAPEIPLKVQGKTNIKVGNKYAYSTNSVDPNNDLITYIFDWGDETYNVTTWKASEEETSFSHSWDEPGTYNVRTRTVDIYGKVSKWSEPLTLTVTKSKTKIKPIFNEIFEKFPIFRGFLLLFF